jgi:hypothetical protein
MITRYPVAYAAQVQGPYGLFTPTWGELRKSLTKPLDAPKSESPVFVPAELEGPHRSIESVKHVSLLVYDIDNKDSGNQLTSERLCYRLMEQKLDSIVYSTASHTRNHPRYRLVIRLSEPLSKALYKKIAEAVVELLEIGPFIDRACLEPSRCYYLPSCQGSNESNFESFSTYGEPLSQFDPRLVVRPPGPEQSSAAVLPSTNHDESAKNVGLVKAMLQSVSADTDYESYRQIVWSVKSLGWNCAPELLVEWSMTSPDHWTEEKAGHSQSTLDSLINSFAPSRGVSIGTLIHVARQNGYSGRVLGQLEESPLIEVAQNDVVEHTNLDKLRGFSLRGDSQQLQQQLEDDVFVMRGIAILGQWTVIYAAPNCGKTLLAIWHLAESIKLGVVQANKIFYVNADDTFRGMTEKLLYAERHGFEMLVPGHKGFEASMVLEIMNSLVDAGAASGVVLILDTLKKFTDLMDKRVASKFGVLARKFTAAGGTLVCLAHTNKHKDAEGNSVYSGTSDIADDCDCVYIMERLTNESGLVDVYSVEGRNEKSRGDVSKKVGFTYTRRVGESYEQLLASVERQDESEVESIKRAREVSAGLIADKEIIEAVIGCLNGGVTTKDKMVKSVSKATAQPQPRVRDVIKARDGTDYMAGHRWTHCKGDNNAQVFSVLHPPITTQPE